MTDKNTKKISLEALLELKKAEKPAPEFWDGFQQDFHQRRLQSMIQKPTLMGRLTSVLASRSSLLLPLSASAVVLFVLAVQVRTPDAASQLDSQFFPVESAQASPDAVFEYAHIDAVNTEISMDNSSAQADFVLDTISPADESVRNYRTEFSNQTLSASSQLPKASYVSYTLERERNYTLASSSPAGAFNF